MTNKQTTKTATPHERTTSPEALKAAYEIHTLAEMIRGRLATSSMPWSTPMPPTTRFEPGAAWTSPVAPEAVAQWTVPTHWPW